MTNLLLSLAFYTSNSSAFQYQVPPSEFDYPGSMGTQMDVAFQDHAAEFDVSIGEFQASLPGQNRVATLRAGGSATVGARIKRFKILDSTMHSAGDTMDVVRLGTEVTDTRSPDTYPPPGQRYLLITYPQSAQKLSDVDATLDAGKSLVVFQTVPVGGPTEETACTILMTDADHVERSASPSENIFWSVFDCLLVSDELNRNHVIQLMWSASYPEPTYLAHTSIKRVEPLPEDALTTAMRQAAKTASPMLRLDILEILNRWGLGDTYFPILSTLADLAHNTKERVWIEFMWDHGPMPKPGAQEAIIVNALDGAVNDEIVLELLSLTDGSYTLEHDRQLAVWLNSPDKRIQYAAALHFAESQKRPDLKPKLDAVAGELVYPDLAEKVEAWKQFFGMN